MFLIMVADGHLFGKQLFIWFTVRVLPERFVNFCTCPLSLLVLRVEYDHFLSQMDKLCFFLFFYRIGKPPDLAGTVLLLLE